MAHPPGENPGSATDHKHNSKYSVQIQCHPFFYMPLQPILLPFIERLTFRRSNIDVEALDWDTCPLVRLVWLQHDDNNTQPYYQQCPLALLRIRGISSIYFCKQTGFFFHRNRLNVILHIELVNIPS